MFKRADTEGAPLSFKPPPWCPARRGRNIYQIHIEGWNDVPGKLIRPGEVGVPGKFCTRGSETNWPARPIGLPSRDLRVIGARRSQRRTIGKDGVEAPYVLHNERDETPCRHYLKPTLLIRHLFAHASLSWEANNSTATGNCLAVCRHLPVRCASHPETEVSGFIR